MVVADAVLDTVDNTAVVGIVGVMLVAASYMIDDFVVDHSIEVVVVAAAVAAAVAMKVVAVVETNKNALEQTNCSFVGKCLASVD